MKILTVILICLVVLAIGPWLLLIAWNNVMPYLFSLKQIGYGQSLCLIVISLTLLPHNWKSTKSGAN